MSDSEHEKPKRRPRYTGKNPRAFHEKYKERDPVRYAGDVEKVLASGKTPAGTHRPILVREILDALRVQPGETVVDCTLGYGGHAGKLLAAVQPGGRLIALDQDPIELPKTEARLRALGFPDESLVVRRTNFAGLAAVVAEFGGADAILADLGLSSMQMDDPARGFTFKVDAPLDMRLNPQRGQPASALLAKVSEPELAAWLAENGDEPHAERIASAMVRARAAQPFASTTQLATCIRGALRGVASTAARRMGEEEIETSVRRVFQAIRIVVNDEFGVLDAFLRNLPHCLKAGGRVAMLTFHSGEDRRVKHAFKTALHEGVFAEVNNDVIRATADERRANPRSTPAKLRWAMRA